MAASKYVRPALLVIDVQEDFCPPNGALAVPAGRDVAPSINDLLSLPFILKIATRDFHPPDHVSFATSHKDSGLEPFTSTVEIRHLDDASQSSEIPLWPAHCVQGSKGAEIIPEVDAAKFDHIVNKGKDRRVETFSGFADVFGRKSLEAIDLNLADTLKSKDITHVFVVGLAGEFCVKCTALDARKEGFDVFLVEDGIRSIDSGDSGWGAATKQMKEQGIQIIKMNSPEIQMVRQLK